MTYVMTKPCAICKRQLTKREPTETVPCVCGKPTWQASSLDFAWTVADEQAVRVKLCFKRPRPARFASPVRVATFPEEHVTRTSHRPNLLAPLYFLYYAKMIMPKCESTR